MMGPSFVAGIKAKSMTVVFLRALVLTTMLALLPQSSQQYTPSLPLSHTGCVCVCVCVCFV